jgi:hypothetical protein
MAKNVLIRPLAREQYDKFMARGRVLFFTAPCGFGKSILAETLLAGQQVLSLTAGEPDFALPADDKDWQVLLIDDLRQMTEEPDQQALYQLIREYSDRRFVLLSRGAVPGWLMAFQYAGLMAVLDADALLFDREDIRSLFRQQGTPVSESELSEILRETSGYPLGVAVIAHCMVGGRPYGPELIAQGYHEVFFYFEAAVYRRFDLPIRRFLLELKELDIENVEALRNIPKKFNKRQKLILTIFCLSFLYIIVIPLLPKDFPGSAVLAPIGTTLIFLLALGILGLIKVDGKPLANPMKLLSEGTLWNVVCIVGCFTFLGNAMASADLGIRDWIISLLKPVFGNMPLPLLLLLLTIVITIITNICNGTPLTLLGNAAIMPFVCQMQLDTGISASVTAATLSLCANMAFLTYAGTIYAALLLDRDEIDNRFIWHDAIKVIPVYIIVVYVIALGCSYILP